MSTNALQDLIDKATAFASTDTSLDKGTHPYFAPSDEPLGWVTKGKVVRLDVAIYGLHLMAARIAFRSMSAQIRQQQIAMQRSVETWGAGKLGLKLGGAVAGKLFECVKIITNQFEAEKIQQNLEKAIRRNSVIVQRDLHDSTLGGAAKRQRKTRWVWSRHKTPRQRAPNESWHSQ